MALALAVRPISAFVSLTTTTTTSRSAVSASARRHVSTLLIRSMSTSSSSAAVSIEHCLSRLSVLQTLLQKHGAPGSVLCNQAGDLQPITNVLETPELVASLAADTPDPLLANLHPYLVPIAQSSKHGDTYICAYRNPLVEESDKKHPWPIVEAKVNGPGMRLLALNSEHLMRRIASEADASNDEKKAKETIDIYNEGLGQGVVADAALDVPYAPGSVAQLGYGVDKYVLLRVGPFADLYQSMAKQHAAKGDEQSSLISAEACNSKLAGFGSNFLYYAQLLSTFPNRQEEARDAARMCLRLPLPTIGMDLEAFREVAVLSQAADPSDTTEEAMAKLQTLYEKMREVESEENTGQADGKTLEQMAMDEANVILDRAVLQGQAWSEVRPLVAEKFRSVGREDFARFVDMPN